MKLLIVLALFGAACAYDEFQPIILGEPEIPAIEIVDFGQLFVPNSVLRELGLEVLPYDEQPQPVHFVNENGDMQSIIDFTPVEIPLEETEPVKFVDSEVQSLMYNAPFEAPVEESYAAPAEIDAVKIVDVVSFVDNEDVDVASPVEFDAVEIADADVVNFVDNAPVEAPVEESAPAEIEPVQIADVNMPSGMETEPVEVVNVVAPIEVEPVQIADAIIPSDMEVAAVEAPVEETNAAPVDIDDANVVSFVDNEVVNVAAPVEVEPVQIAEPALPAFEAPVKDSDASPTVIDAVKIVDFAPESPQEEANVRDLLRKYRGKIFPNPLWR